MTDYIDTDVLIIGGGPAGCSCALYTSRSSLKTYVLAKNPSVGALAITHKIANYPGVSNEISGSDLLEMMRNQAISYGTTYMRAQVFSLDLSGEYKLAGLEARIFQHEFDHMEGTNFTKRVSKLRLQRALKRAQKQLKKSQINKT